MKNNTPGKAYVYKITSPSGRVYVGSTANIEQRFKYYRGLRCKKQTRLYQSFVKYGVEYHLFEIIWEGSDQENYLEIEAQKGHSLNALCQQQGLNCVLPKAGDFPYTRSLESRARLSIATMGEKHHNFGKKASEETKRKMSLVKIGKKNPAQSQSLRKAYSDGKIKSWNKGKKCPQISESVKGDKHIFWGKKRPEHSEIMKGNIPANSKLVYDSATGIYYTSVLEASQSLNIKFPSLYAMLTGRYKNKTSLSFC